MKTGKLLMTILLFSLLIATIFYFRFFSAAEPELNLSSSEDSVPLTALKQHHGSTAFPSKPHSVEPKTTESDGQYKQNATSLPAHQLDPSQTEQHTKDEERQRQEVERVTAETLSFISNEPTSAEPENNNREVSPDDDNYTASNNTADSEYAAVEETDDEIFQRRLSGWVIDEAGLPVPDFYVEAIARHLPAGKKNTARKKSTKTDQEGHFGFSQLPDGTYEVRTNGTDRYKKASAILHTGNLSAVLVVSEKTDSLLYLFGFVENTLGELLEEVRVEPVGRARLGVYTDKQGWYGLSLPLDQSDEQATIRFMLDGYQEHQLRLSKLKKLADANELERNIILEPITEQALVIGTVHGSDGVPINWARVQLYSVGSKYNEQTVTDTSGRFTFDVPPASDYRLWVRPQEGYQDLIEEGLSIEEDITLPVVLERQEYCDLTGQMVDAEGRPVSRFTLMVRTEQKTSNPFTSVRGDKKGYFSLNDLPAGGLTLQTRSQPRLAFSGIKLKTNTVNKVRLVVDTGNYYLDGFVLDEQSTPLPLAQVRLDWSQVHQGVRSSSSRKTITDAAGYFLFTQLGAGTHEISIGATGYRPIRRGTHVSAESEKVQMQVQLAKISL